MAGFPQQQGFSERRGSKVSEDMTLNTTIGQRAEKTVVSRQIRGPPTPSMTTPAIDFDQQVAASPPPPPTPAPSPGPSNILPDWRDAADDEDFWLSNVRHHFKNCPAPQRTRILADLLNLCTSQQLSFVHQFVTPLLKKDPFTTLPNELCLRILSFIDDPKVLLRASQVSSRWRDLLSDEVTWKNLCDKHDYCRGLPDLMTPSITSSPTKPLSGMYPFLRPEQATITANTTGDSGNSNSNSSNSSGDAISGLTAESFALGSIYPSGSRSFDGSQRPRRKARSYKSHFKQRYLVEAAWRNGGTNITRNISPEGRVATSLHLTSRYIVVALDNAKIMVFDTRGKALRTLIGHVMGVWAMVLWGNILVSGGCDRDVRVWDLSTGVCLHTLRGHTSTVRCLKMADEHTAISGSRDTTLRIWDTRTGLCRNVLVGHQASVRCLDIKDDIVVSGSYDTTAKVWSISTGRCLQTLQGHYSQIYAIAYDGKRVVTGSLDTNVRIWDPVTAECLAILQGHTSLVGQLQMRGNTLVTGGSDGSVRVWSLEKMCPIHRLAAHDNSVTSLQFDDTRVVSGGSDGRLKIWDLKTGYLVRELLAHCDTVWRVAFENEKCVILAQRQGCLVMEVWSFSAPEDDEPSERPFSLLSRKQLDDDPQRSLSAMAVDYPTAQPPQQPEEEKREDASIKAPPSDVVMGEAGSSNYPLPPIEVP